VSEFEYTDINDPSSGTYAQRQAAEEMAAAALEHWRDKALAKHPGASALREYLTADSAAGVEALAAELEGKLGTGAGGQQSPPSPSVTGGSPALGSYQGDGGDYTQERAMEDIRNGVDREKVFAQRLTQKFHDAGMLAPSEEY
jgi:hypothetical protein